MLIARITCMFPRLCAQGSSIAEYLDYSRLPVEKMHLRACVPVRLARVYTHKLHLRGGGVGGGGGGATNDMVDSTSACLLQ